MSNLSDFTGGGVKPKLITSYTSGTGTYVPTENNARCFVRLTGGGAGGHASGSGGGGGAMVEVFIRIPIAGIAYAVGAGGSVATDGGNTTVGQFTAIGGRYDNTGLHTSMFGGTLATLVGGVDADSVTGVGATGLNGLSGGMGGNASNPGTIAGFPIGSASSLVVASGAASLSKAGNGQGNNSGGNSPVMYNHTSLCARYVLPSSIICR